MTNEKCNSLLNIDEYLNNNRIELLSSSKKCGLANTGHTCYINTIIQLLGHCYPFTLMLLDKKTKDKTLSHELKEIFDLTWNKGHSLRPYKFLKSLQSKFSFINIHEQQDSHEILSLIINKLNEELKIDISTLIPNNAENNSNDSSKLSINCDKAWFKHHKNEYSEIVELFYGQIINQIKCSNCSKIHHSYDYFSCLNLEIPNIKSMNIKLNDCIDSYFASMVLNDKSKSSNENTAEWKCDKCKQSAPSKKVSKIWKLPPMLFVCLKRNQNIKIHNNVEIPNLLDFACHQISQPIDKYNFTGSAIHIGDINFGHYIAMIKNAKDKVSDDFAYTLIDDVNITKISLQKGLNLVEKSYILLYSRTNDNDDNIKH